MIEVVSEFEIFKKVKTLPLEHSSELDQEEGSWEEKGYNYRLNVCDTKYYLLKDNIVIGHLGLLDNVVKAVYINPQYQGQGYSLLLYKQVFKDFKQVFSDDVREPGGEAIWKKLKETYPDKVKYHKKRDQYEFNLEGFN